MTTETFFANFGHLADAPNGVKKLRELILQLAVQGKLVLQDPNDEPASVLLERIEAQKKRLVKEGMIKNTTALPSVLNEEFPFDLPGSWIWARLGSVTTYGQADKAELKDVTDEMWVLELEDVEKVTSCLLQRVRCKDRQFRSSKNKFQQGDVIYGKLRPYLDKVIVADEDGVCTTEMLPIRGYLGISTEYLRWALKTPAFIEYATSSTHGMNLPRMSTDKGRLAPFPLPPLAEQKRIVAKVDQLMSLCDELETRQKKQQQARVRLNSAALDALLTASKPDELADHWQRISTNFDLLYDHPETIAKLRAAILQLAVQGKLVPQDPNDEPASVLLERIRAEKERLVNDVKSRKTILSSHIKESEHPFFLPAGWSWVRLGDFGLFLGGGTPSKQNPAFWSGEIPWVSPKDMKVQNISDSIDHVSQEAIDNSSVKLIPEGALLMVVRGMILLHSFPVAKNLREVTVNQDMKALICALPETSEYLLRLLIAEKVRILDRVERSSHGTCRLESKKLSGFVVALPPLAEQKRIVAKVDQLIALCDELEIKLNQGRQRSEKVLEATVRQLLVA